MKVATLKKKSKAMRDFDKVQWKLYDTEHYGKKIEWETVYYHLKASHKREILGTLALKIEAGVGKVDTLIVHSEKQKQGVGKTLLKKAEELTKNHNGHKLFLITGRNWDAVTFYESLGFKKEGDLRNQYFHVDFVYMSKFF